MSKNRTKFNVSKNLKHRTHNGIVFGSKLERDFYRDWLLPRYKDGRIVKFELQKRYNLQPSFEHEGKKIRAIDYVSDFYFVTASGREIVIDTKGLPTADAKMKRKMMWYVHPEVEFYWVAHSKKFGGWLEYDELQKLKKEAKKRALQGEE